VPIPPNTQAAPQPTLTAGDGRNVLQHARALAQRPDVRAAEELLHSASAQIGVATANMLPNFTIGANGGYINSALAGLISPPTAFWLLAGNATQTLFDGGTLLHQRRAAAAAYDQSAWAYKATVIGAAQNVADVLRALQNDADALRAARAFERAAKISFDLARQQVETGNANVLFLLTAQTTYLQALIQVVQARAARLADTAALFQALGGGWWNRVVPPKEKILNVGTGQDISIGEFARLVSEVVGYRGALAFDTSRPDGSPQKLLDVSKLSALGWRAKVPLRQGLAAAYADFLAGGGRFRS